MDKTFTFARIHTLEQTTSTMDEARRLSARAPSGVVMAEVQSAGRGRLPGRVWNTQSGQALLATAWFPRSALDGPGPSEAADLDSEPARPGGRLTAPEPPISLMAGLAVTKACLAWSAFGGYPFRNSLAVKWPNDVLCGQRKLAGILCEAAGGTIYIGMGINCSQDSFTGVYRTAPTSILMETGQAPVRDRLLALILDELDTLIAGQTNWHMELDQFLAWKGKAVEFRQGLAQGQPHRGTLIGVADDGGILLDTGGTMKAFHSGELSPVIDEYS